MTEPAYAACGCEWSGAFCPHCGQPPVGDAHVKRCHSGGAAYAALLDLRDVREASDKRDAAILAADGLISRRGIAAELGISPTTVYDVLRKAGRIHD